MLLNYTLQLNYVYTQDNESVYYPSNPLDPLITQQFTELSNITDYSLTDLITPHDFTGDEVVDTEITVCLRITEQCGQGFYGEETCYKYDSGIPWIIYSVIIRCTHTATDGICRRHM